MNSPPLIAVVDDDPGVRGSLDSLLRSDGMTGLPFASTVAGMPDHADYIARHVRAAAEPALH